MTYVLRKTLRPRETEEIGPDALPLSLVPSLKKGDNRNRVLAEIDQDGFAFAVDARDIPLFNSRTTYVSRRHRKLQIVLQDGMVCVRKFPPHQRDRRDISGRIRDMLGWGFYLEAAALLRLQDLQSVPKLRKIDLRNHVIDMDYVWGCNLRLVLGPDHHNCPRCTGFLTSVHRDDIQATTKRVLGEVTSKGVVPLDVHPANFICGCRSGRIYLIDFHLVHFQPIPGWQERRRLLDQMEYM